LARFRVGLTACLPRPVSASPAGIGRRALTGAHLLAASHRLIAASPRQQQLCISRGWWGALHEQLRELRAKWGGEPPLAVAAPAPAARTQAGGSHRRPHHLRCRASHIGPAHSVIGESAAIATQGKDSGLHTGYRAKLLRRFFARRGRPPSCFGRPRHAARAPLVLLVRTPPGTDSNPNPLPLQPLPGRRGDLAQNGAHPRSHPAVDKNQGPRVRRGPGAHRGGCFWAAPGRPGCRTL
jgi:hypothetical protein